MSTTPTSWLAVASVVVPVVVSVVTVPSVVDGVVSPESGTDESGTDESGTAPQVRSPGLPYAPAYGLVTLEMLVPAAEVAAALLPATWTPPMAIAAAEATPAAPRMRGRGRLVSFMVVAFELRLSWFVVSRPTTRLGGGVAL
jgi:hypothetical protein